jgi:hypothetical protein
MTMRRNQREIKNLKADYTAKAARLQYLSKRNEVEERLAKHNSPLKKPVNPAKAVKIAKRYKQMGKNFCAYLYNVFKHEVARMIKSNIKNPLSIPYKNFQYEDYINGSEDNYQIESYEDTYYESSTGLPDISWVLGDTCGFEFVYLSPLQRKILVRYYLEDWSDRQIAESMGVQTSMINLKRRQALQILCEEFDVDINSLKRTRKSGTVKNKSK